VLRSVGYQQHMHSHTHTRTPTCCYAQVQPAPGRDRMMVLVFKLTAQTQIRHPSDNTLRVTEVGS